MQCADSLTLGVQERVSAGKDAFSGITKGKAEFHQAGRASPFISTCFLKGSTGLLSFFSLFVRLKSRLLMSS